MTDRDPIETAWRIHAAMADWTGKVDSKATFALTFQTALLGVVVALSTDKLPLGHLVGSWPLGMYRVGIAFLAISVTLSVYAVMPRIRTKAVQREWPNNFIYFGHTRYWDAQKLQEAMEEYDPLPMLCRQIVVMSRIAWRKHFLVGVSFSASLAGAGLIALAGIFG